MSTTTEDTLAPDGTVWVCLACGKTSPDRAGGSGWDISCFISAVLCRKDKLVFDDDGRVVKVDHGGVVEDDRPLDETTSGRLARRGGPRPTSEADE